MPKMSVVRVRGSITIVPKTITRFGKRWEQAAGAPTLQEARKILDYNKKTFTSFEFILVKAILGNKPAYPGYMGEQVFYFTYHRRKK